MASSPGRPGTIWSNVLDQPLASGSATQWFFRASLRLQSESESAPPPLVLDGSASPHSGSTFNFWLCEEGTDCLGGIVLAACNPTDFVLNRHTITFEGGQAILDVRKLVPEGMSAGHEPAAFVVASGTLDDAAFSQQDYYRLLYAPNHHHFRRDFAVLFAEPIGSASGLKLIGESSDPPPR